MSKIYLSHSRSGLLIALKNENYKPNQEILIPDYICESVTNLLIANKMNLQSYKITKSLRIDWNDLNEKITKNSKFLVIVNFFGFPLDLNKALEFAKKHKLILLEDSTHCMHGKYQGKFLGNFGHYGLTSPRKHIPIKFGGILHSQKKISFKLKSYYFSSLYDVSNYYFTKNLLKSKLSIKNFFSPKIKRVKRNYEEIVNISSLDNFSLKKIQSTNWDSIRNLKQENYQFWKYFSDQNKLNSIINFNIDDLNPWAFPVLLNSKVDLIYWLNWAKKNNVIVFTWPTLSSNIFVNEDAKMLANNLLCFSTYTRL